MLITQAVISAGGRGERLRPFTEHAPKPMIPVLGKPLLEWHLEQYKKHGVTEFFFMLGFLPEVIVNHFGDGSRFGVSIRYIVEDTPRGSAGSLHALADELDETFYFIYGDVFSLLDYTQMVQAYGKLESPIGMERVALTRAYADANVAELDETQRFIAVHKKPHIEKSENRYRMRGIFLLNRAFLSYLAPQGKEGIAEDVVPKLIAAGKNFYGYQSADYSKGIDTLEKLQKVEAHLKEHGITPWW